MHVLLWEVQPKGLSVLDFALRALEVTAALNTHGESFFIFSFEIPPSTTTFFLLSLESNLNLFIPRKFLFFLNKEDKKIFPTFCISLVLISLRL